MGIAGGGRIEGRRWSVYYAEGLLAIGDFLEDNAPFEKVVVFGMKARLSGFWVPDDYIAAFVANAPEKLLGFASCDPTQPGYLEELLGEECLVVIRKHPHVYADISALYYRPWQFYTMLIAAQEYHVIHKLLFGTDYPFAGGPDSIEGLRHANDVIGESGLPRVSEEVIADILHRDSLSLLGIGV